MTKKIIFTAVLIVICCGSFFIGVYTFGAVDSSKDTDATPVAVEDAENVPVVRQKGPILSLLFPDIDKERGIQKALTEKSREVLGVWATLKILNGVINVLQSAQVGGSFFVEASINPLEFLAPISSVMDDLSSVLLWALGAIIFEKVLLSISGYIVFLVVIPICAIISIITLWTYVDRSRIHRVLIVSVIICLLIPLAIPISFQASTLMETKILTNNVSTLVASIQEKNKTAESMEKDVTGLARVGRSITNYMVRVKDLGNALIEDMINYVILFFFTNVFIPIFTILGLYYLARYFIKLILSR